MNTSVSPLMQAYHFLQKVANEGFDWDSSLGPANKVQEELKEVLQVIHNTSMPHRQEALREEIGDLFLACCCLARHCHVEPDTAIVEGLSKFNKRYEKFKMLVEEKGISLKEASSKEILALWQQMKKEKVSYD